MTALFAALAIFFLVLALFSLFGLMAIFQYLQDNWKNTKTPLRSLGVVILLFTLLLSCAVFFTVEIFVK